MLYNTEITLNRSELALTQMVSSNKIIKMKDELIRNSIPKCAELISTHATYLKKRVDNSGLTESEIRSRFDDLTSTFIKGEFPYSVYLKINKSNLYIINNPFERINKILNDIILTIDSNILFENANQNEYFDKELKNEIACFLDSIYESKSNVFDNIFESLSLFCIPGKWIGNGKDFHYEIMKTANPFKDFDTFYAFITNPHIVLKNLIEHESEEDMSMSFLNKYTSAEIVSNPVLSKLVMFKYTQLRTFLFEFENMMDLIVLCDTMLGYIIDNEEIDAPILDTVMKSFSDEMGRIMNYEDQKYFFYSKEGIDGTEFTINKSNAKTLNGVKLSDVNEKYKSKSVKLKQAWIKTFKMGPEKRKMAKDAKFFKKYFGRIPGLYQSYGSEAKVYENRMKDDPAKVLANDAVKYIDNLTQFSDTQFNELIDIAKKVSSSSDGVQRMSYINSYCKHYKIDTQDDPKVIRAQILNETYFRIATALFKNITIYGFTEEGVVQNHKFPSANHIVVSMFIDNPNEMPEELSVNEIFKNPNSLLVFSKPENFVKFTNLYATASTKVIGSFNDKNIETAVDEIHKTSDRVNYQLKNDNGESSGEQADPKLQKQVMKAIEKGIVDSIDLMVDQKQRVLQCAAVAYQMVSRISRTARLCVTAMLEVESKHTDSSYSGSFKNKNNNRDVKRLKANRDHVEKQENVKERKVNRNGLSGLMR